MNELTDYFERLETIPQAEKRATSDTTNDSRKRNKDKHLQKKQKVKGDSSRSSAAGNQNGGGPRSRSGKPRKKCIKCSKSGRSNRVIFPHNTNDCEMGDTPERKTEKDHSNKLFTMVKKIAKENKKLHATVAKIGKNKMKYISSDRNESY